MIKRRYIRIKNRPVCLLIDEATDDLLEQFRKHVRLYTFRCGVILYFPITWCVLKLIGFLPVHGMIATDITEFVPFAFLIAGLLLAKWIASKIFEREELLFTEAHENLIEQAHSPTKMGA